MCKHLCVAFICGLLALASAGEVAAEGVRLVLPGQQRGVLTAVQLPGLLGADGLQLRLELQHRGLVVGTALPGLDGLSVYLPALGSPLSRLNDALINALRARAPADALTDLSHGLLQPLPGLGDSVGIALPGLDGLPVGAMNQ